MSERVVAGDQLNLPGDQRRGELQQRRPWSMSPTVVLFQNRARAGHPRPRRPSPPCPRCPSHVSFFLSPSGVSYLSLFVHRYLGAPIAPVRLCSCLRQAKAAGPRRRSKQEPWLKLQCAAPPRLLPNLPGRPPLLDPVAAPR